MLVKQKYRLLFSPKQICRPGPKGPTKALIEAVVEMKRRNRTWGYKRIAQQIALAFGVDIDNSAIHTPALPKYLSSDHDPLYLFYQWQANLRVLEIQEVKTVPYVPLSHPFVERLIGTIRREYVDHTLFWTAIDLENKLRLFQGYFNRQRVHSRLRGRLPDSGGRDDAIKL